MTFDKVLAILEAEFDIALRRPSSTYSEGFQDGIDRCILILRRADR